MSVINEYWYCILKVSRIASLEDPLRLTVQGEPREGAGQ